MNETEKKFINSVPVSDPGYAVKGVQIKEWYKPFGRKILEGADLSYVAQKLNNFSDDKYWMRRQSGDFILNRSSVVKELLSIKKADGENLLDDYDRYQAVCWLCLEESIRSGFSLLDKYKGDSESEGEFVTETLSRHSELKAFWSHYIHVVNEDNTYVTSPNKEILNSLEGLIAKYNENYDKNLDCNNQVDLWKYGFECAKEEGCIEALEFFLNKLEGGITQDEYNEILVNTTLYATSSGSFNLRHSNANVIDFCFTHLGADKYKMLLKKDFEVCSYSILYRFKMGYLFGYVKELINCLGAEGISNDRYSINFIYGGGEQIGAAPNKELMKIGSDFLIWMWDKAEFIKHREHCLDMLGAPGRNAGLTDMLSDLAKVGAFEPLEKILDSASETGRKEIAKSFRNSDRACCALYIQGRKDLLDKVLDGAKYSNNYVRAIEEILKQNLAYKQKWNCASNLHKEFKIKESMTKILELLSDYGLSDAIEKKMNEFVQAHQIGDGPSSLSDLKSTVATRESISK